jgi:hypothetical protein
VFQWKFSTRRIILVGTNSATLDPFPYSYEGMISHVRCGALKRTNQMDGLIFNQDDSDSDETQVGYFYGKLIRTFVGDKLSA